MKGKPGFNLQRKYRPLSQMAPLVKHPVAVALNTAVHEANAVQIQSLPQKMRNHQVWAVGAPEKSVLSLFARFGGNFQRRSVQEKMGNGKGSEGRYRGSLGMLRRPLDLSLVSLVIYTLSYVLLASVADSRFVLKA